MSTEYDLYLQQHKSNVKKMYESDDKMVSHPGHYQSKSGLEVIDVVEAFTDGLNGVEATDTGNIIKYICRWKKKNGIQDLKKVMWYTQHLIEHLESEEIKSFNSHDACECCVHKNPIPTERISSTCVKCMAGDDMFERGAEYGD